MRVDELPASAPYAAASVAGLVLAVAGVGASRWLPKRYEITHSPSPASRRVGDVALLLTTIGCAIGLAVRVAGASAAPLGLAMGWFLANAVLASALVTAARIDFDHMILPNEITLGGALLALATSSLRSDGFRAALVGAVFGAFIAYVPAAIYKRIRGRSGFGMGDTKLVILAGAWHGVEGVMFVMIAGLVQALVATAFMRLIGKPFTIPESVRAELADLEAKAIAGDADARAALEDDVAHTHGSETGNSFAAARFPLGPFLVLACLEFLFARRYILDWLR